MSNETYGFSISIQKMLVAMLLFEQGALALYMDVMKPEYFDNPALSSMVETMRKFFKQYNRCPTWDEFLEEMSVYIDRTPNLPKEEYFAIIDEVLASGTEGDFSYVRDKAVDFARFQEARKAIMESADLLEKRKDYEGICKRINNAMMLGEVRSDLGTFYYEELEDRLKDRKCGLSRRSVCIPTNLKRLNARLGGGIAPTELGIIMGSAKRGKTITAANFVAGALIHGCNAVHYMLEGGSEFRTSAIYDSMISRIPADKLEDREEEVRRKVNNFFGDLANGRLVIKFFPANTCSALTIDAHLRWLKARKNFVPKLIVIDYLGLLKPIEKMNVGDRYLVFGQIVTEILSLTQKGHYATWLLHQSTRASYGKDLVGMDDSADSIEPMRHADIILTLNQNKEDMESRPERVRYHSPGARSVADRWTEMFSFDKSTCKIFDSSEETEWTIH